MQMSRKEQLKDELERFLSVLSDDRSVRKIIVFGSYTSGNIRELSDLDIVVVQDTELRFRGRLKQMKKRIQPKVGMDLLVYTPDEYHRSVSSVVK